MNILYAEQILQIHNAYTLSKTTLKNFINSNAL